MGEKQHINKPPLQKKTSCDNPVIISLMCFFFLFVGFFPLPTMLGMEKQQFLGRVSRGRPGGYPGGRPDPKTFTPSFGAQENRVFVVAQMSLT